MATILPRRVRREQQYQSILVELRIEKPQNMPLLRGQLEARSKLQPVFGAVLFPKFYLLVKELSLPAVYVKRGRPTKSAKLAIAPAAII